MKLYLFDADGTLRRCTVPGRPCPNKKGEWELLPDVKARLAEIDWAQTAIGVVSNQAGVAMGYMTAEVAGELLMDTLVEATGEWCPFWPIKFCPHAVTAGCLCRKPEKALIWEAIQDVRRAGFKLLKAETNEANPIEFSEVLFVGDTFDDQGAAAAAGVHFQWAHEFFRWHPAPNDPGIAWEGNIWSYGVTMKARLFGGATPTAHIWTEGGWREATSRVRPLVFSQARAGLSFWEKSKARIGPST